MQQHRYRDLSFTKFGVGMDTCFIFGVPGILLEGGNDDRRSRVASVIGDLILRALEAATPGVEPDAAAAMLTSEVRLLCEPDINEVATFVWSGGRMYELDAIPDKDLREAFDSLERQIISRWKLSNPGYSWGELTDGDND